MLLTVSLHDKLSSSRVYMWKIKCKRTRKPLFRHKGYNQHAVHVYTIIGVFTRFTGLAKNLATSITYAVNKTSLEIKLFIS